MHSAGLFFEKSEERAIALYELAAELGGNAGQLNYGCHLLRSNNPQEVAKGLTLITQAAESGLSRAQAILARQLVEGGIVARDFDRAFRLFNSAAAAGDLDGIVGLGMSYANG